MPLTNQPSAGNSQIIASRSIPTNPFAGLIWHELDVNKALIETWSYTGSKWMSGYKNIHTRARGAGMTAASFDDYFAFDDNYNVFIETWTANLLSSVVINAGNPHDFYFLKHGINAAAQFRVNNLAASTNYLNVIAINQEISLSLANMNLFGTRTTVPASSYNFWTTSSYRYKLVRK